MSRSDRKNRREFLIQAGAAGAVAGVVGCTESKPPAPAPPPDTKAGDVEILQSALALEHQGIAAYQAALDSGLIKDEKVADVARKFQNHHKDHRAALTDAIRNLGGKPAEKKDAYDFGAPKRAEDLLRLAAKIENTAANAYADAVGKLGDRRLAVQAAKILGAEAWHTAVLRSALGDDPAPSWELTA